MLPTIVQMCEWLGVSKSGYLRMEDAAAKRDRASAGSC